jgi:hypothetical protein
MKPKINARLRKVLSKHFVNKLFVSVAVPIRADRESIVTYWLNCPQALKHTSLCFFSKELIELVNNTNTKLLYADFLTKTNRGRTKSGDESLESQTLADDKGPGSSEDDYQLLNAFELLWNVEGAFDATNKLNKQATIVEVDEYEK